MINSQNNIGTVPGVSTKIAALTSTVPEEQAKMAAILPLIQDDIAAASGSFNGVNVGVIIQYSPVQKAMRCTYSVIGLNLDV
jgi:hypothetical protein